MTKSVSALRVLAAALAFAGLSMAAPVGAQADTMASACGKTYAAATLDVTQPINLGQLKLQVYFYACSGAYDSELSAVAASAQTYLEKRAAEVSRPALVLDIDETSLSNLPQELATDFGYVPGGDCDHLPDGPCGFNAWVAQAKAKAIDGTLALFKAARAHNVAVFFVTGRHENEKDATVKNLQAAGYDGYAGLALRLANDRRTVIDYKSSERGRIAQQGYTIIVNMGDQQSDLAGGYAERAYKLPNPFYYIP
jgi:acid phosphatase